MLSAKKMHAIHRAENPSSQLSLQTVYQAIKKGDLKAIKVGNRNLIAEENFNRWLMGEKNG